MKRFGVSACRIGAALRAQIAHEGDSLVGVREAADGHLRSNAPTVSQRQLALGAGELLVTSIDRDGTKAGFDTELLRVIADLVVVPVIASGGAAGPEDFVAAVRDGGADAVLAAGIPIDDVGRPALDWRGPTRELTRGEVNA